MDSIFECYSYSGENIKNSSVPFLPLIKWKPHEEVFEDSTQNWSKKYVPLIKIKDIEFLQKIMEKNSTIIHENITNKTAAQIRNDLISKLSKENFNENRFYLTIDDIIKFIIGNENIIEPNYIEKLQKSLCQNKISNKDLALDNYIMICHQGWTCPSQIYFINLSYETFEKLLVDKLLIILSCGINSEEIKMLQMGQTLGRLLVNKDFYSKCINMTNIDDLNIAIKDYITEAVLIPSNPYNNYLRPSPEIFYDVDEKIINYHEINKLTNEKKSIQNSFTKQICSFNKLFQGLKTDVNNRKKTYLNDFTDGFHFQIIISAVFMYFACLAPIITFGGLLSAATNGNLGTIESLLSGALCGVIYSIFSGQPLTILGSTGPILVFETIIYQICQQNHIYYLSFRLWIGIWISIFLLIMVVCNISDMVKYITKFTEESFATLISVIYIYEASKNLLNTYKSYSGQKNLDEQRANDNRMRNSFHSNMNRNGSNLHNSELLLIENLSKFQLFNGTSEIKISENHSNIFLFSIILAIGTYIIAINLKKVQHMKILPLPIRNFIFDSAVILAIVFLTTCDYLFQIDTPKLQIPETFQPTIGFENRTWLIPLFNGNPFWTAFVAFIPAFLAVILIFLDQQITAVIINKNIYLRKEKAYHLDLLVLAILIFINSFMGTPWFVAATVLSISHMNSLQYHSHNNQYREQRVSGILIGVAIGMTIMFTPILKLIPMSILYGVFLIMGISSLENIEFMQRVKLLLTPYKDRPDILFLRFVKIKRVHIFTIIQIISFATLWTVKSVKEISIGFPFMVLAMCFVRKYLEKYFTIQELYWLDDLYPGNCFTETENSRLNHSNIIISLGELETKIAKIQC